MWEELLRYDDPLREGLLRTPERARKAYEFLLSGYKEETFDVCFSESCSEVIVTSDFYSLCEHHILPFFGTIEVSYVPNGKVIGLSKIPRIINMYSRRLQIQERLTRQIGEKLRDLLDPKELKVISRARHLCVAMRGVQQPSEMTAIWNL